MATGGGYCQATLGEGNAGEDQIQDSAMSGEAGELQRAGKSSGRKRGCLVFSRT
jgi:hypothetical protein